ARRPVAARARATDHRQAPQWPHGQRKRALPRRHRVVPGPHPARTAVLRLTRVTTASFDGFVAGGAAVPVPAQFFVEVLPEIEDAAELHVTLYALYAIARRRGPLRAVRRSEIASEGP